MPAMAVAPLVYGRVWSSSARAAAELATGAVLPGVDLARRAVQPSQEFPATWGEDEPLAPSDPRIAWRELYSLDAEKPYYQNIKTMEVRWEIPEGFVTRFPRLYEANGYRVDERGAVFSAATDATDGSASAAGGPTAGGAATALPGAKTDGVKALTLKQRMAAYGAGGLLWYLIVHSISFCCVFACLYVFRIDLIGLARSYGFDIKRSTEVAVMENKRPPFWKTFVVALVLNKMMVPAHLLITVTTAPFLVHRLEPVAARLFPAARTFVQSLMGKGKVTPPPTAKA